MTPCGSSCSARTPATNCLSPPIPDNYAEMGAWAHTYLAGWLILLGRARRELKTAAFEDIALVYRSLLLLAFEYRDMRMGRQDDSAFNQKLKQYGLECTGSIDPSRARQEGDTYFVNYPQGSPQKEFLRFHLCKGISRDPRYCLRIYFFWDEDAEIVVVGSLPGHLDNQLT